MRNSWVFMTLKQFRLRKIKTLLGSEAHLCSAAPPSPSAHLIIMTHARKDLPATHARKNLPATAHFEVKDISWLKFSQSQGLKNPFKVRKDHQGTDRIKWSTAGPKAKISGRCHSSLACEYIKSPEVKSHLLFSSHHCSSPRESIRSALFSDHNQGLSNLGVHENPPPGSYVNGGSEAPPPELSQRWAPRIFILISCRWPGIQLLEALA